jgi:FcoT-like thioesterase domain
MTAISLEARRPPGGIAEIVNRAAVFAPNRFAPAPLVHDLRERHPTAPRFPIAISDSFVAEILKPYRPHARYLKSAEITQVSEEMPDDAESKTSLVSGVGRFSIPESCYIDDTGHFNAVEFNICYNQLAYVVFGKCVAAGLLHRVWPASVAHIPSFTEYKKHQLPAMLIVRVDGVRFFRMMKSDDFRAEFRIDRMTMLGQAGFFYTSITFSDCEGVKAKGNVVLAFQPNLTQPQE